MRNCARRICTLLLLGGSTIAQEKSACSLPDCDQAKAFFQQFQKAMNEDKRQDAASLVSYPLKSYRHGKATIISNKSQLFAKYDSVFDAPTRCAIRHAGEDDVWGNWRGFTVAQGVIWWDRIIPRSVGTVQLAAISKYRFGVFSVNHGGPLPKECETATAPK
jgi:hypothetical protein